MKNSINKKEIEELLPHREPMLLIDELTSIVKLKSATAIVNVKKNSFYVQGHFPGQPVMPGVVIVEAFGQAAAALTAYGIDKSEYKWKVNPVDLYHWAMVSRISIPDEFNILMTFVTQSVKNPNNSFSTNNENLIDEIYQLHKEVVLGATTSLLVNSPDICRNNEGKIDSTIIVKKIIENERHWFNGCESKLSESDMTSLIKQYIAMSKPIY